MVIQRLSVILQQLEERRAGAGAAPARPFFERGEVQEVLGTGEVLVLVAGRVVHATPVTDEPYRKGMLVFVSETPEGTIVHGGVRR